MFRQVVVTRSAKKDLAKLTPQDRERILRSLHIMKDSPKVVDLRKLEGIPDIWRLRVGKWRVILRITEKEMIAYALHVRHRREAYRKL